MLFICLIIIFVSTLIQWGASTNQALIQKSLNTSLACCTYWTNISISQLLAALLLGVSVELWHANFVLLLTLVHGMHQFFLFILLLKLLVSHLGAWNTVPLAWVEDHNVTGTSMNAPSKGRSIMLTSNEFIFNDTSVFVDHHWTLKCFWWTHGSWRHSTSICDPLILIIT